MHLFRHWAIHPGYKETIPDLDRVPPAYMLAPERDDERQPSSDGDRADSFNLWLGECEKYAALAGLTVVRHGIAPKDYQTMSPGATGVYTYRRFVQRATACSPSDIFVKQVLCEMLIKRNAEARFRPANHFVIKF